MRRRPECPSSADPKNDSSCAFLPKRGSPSIGSLCGSSQSCSDCQRKGVAHHSDNSENDEGNSRKCHAYTSCHDLSQRVRHSQRDDRIRFVLNHHHLLRRRRGLWRGYSTISTGRSNFRGFSGSSFYLDWSRFSLSLPHHLIPDQHVSAGVAVFYPRFTNQENRYLAHHTP